MFSLVTFSIIFSFSFSPFSSSFTLFVNGLLLEI